MESPEKTHPLLMPPSPTRSHTMTTASPIPTALSLSLAEKESRLTPPISRSFAPITTSPNSTAGYLTYSQPDRKSTRLNSSHSQISYAVFCLKKKKHEHTRTVRLLQHIAVYISKK